MLGVPSDSPTAVGLLAVMRGFPWSPQKSRRLRSIERDSVATIPRSTPPGGAPGGRGGAFVGGGGRGSAQIGARGGSASASRLAGASESSFRIGISRRQGSGASLRDVARAGGTRGAARPRRLGEGLGARFSRGGLAPRAASRRGSQRGIGVIVETSASSCARLPAWYAHCSARNGLRPAGGRSHRAACFPRWGRCDYWRRGSPAARDARAGRRRPRHGATPRAGRRCSSRA